MPNYLSVTLVGHLGKDPIARDVNGKKVTSFSIAYTPRFPKDADTMWFNCTIWQEKLGQVVMQYLKKGAAVMVVGAFSMRTYEGKDLLQKTSLEINVQDLTMLGGKNDYDEAPPKQIEEDLEIPF